MRLVVQCASVVGDLTTDQVDEVVRLYYDGAKSRRSRHIRHQVVGRDLVSIFSIVLGDATCLYCKVPMWRTGSPDLEPSKKPYCPNCNHSLQDNCQCSNCVGYATKGCTGAGTQTQNPPRFVWTLPATSRTLSLSRSSNGLSRRSLRRAFQKTQRHQAFDALDEPLVPTTNAA